MTSLLYLYGFVPAGTGAPDGEPTGIDARPVEVEELGPFGAAVSRVDEESYAEGALESRLKDLAWVGERGIRHERVVTWFCDHATIVPARLFTFYKSVDSLQAEATERAAAVAERLERFRDMREWDLKVSYDQAVLAEHLAELSPEMAEQDAAIRAAAPGKRYLLERKREGMLGERASDAARELARKLLDELGALAEDVRELELPTSQTELPVVASAALLVSASRQDELRRIATRAEARLAAQGVHGALTGPWAPYRFVGEELHG